MGIQDIVNFIIYTTPATAYNILDNTVQSVGLKPKKLDQIKLVSPEPLWKLARATGPCYVLGALSGASAIALEMYGSREKFLERKSKEEKEKFFNATQYHLLHSLVLLGLPMCRRPMVAATFMTAGIILFCGTTYYHIIQEKSDYQQLARFGSLCFIFGWLAIIF